MTAHLRADKDKFDNPDHRFGELTRIILKLIQASNLAPLANMKGVLFDVSYTLERVPEVRQAMLSFPDLNTAAGRKQHKENNEQMYIILQTIFGDAYPQISQNFLPISEYNEAHSAYHIYDEHGVLKERFPIAAAAINKLFEYCKEDASVMNELLRKKIKLYKPPTTTETTSILDHNKTLQEIQDLWNANKMNPDVQSTEPTVIHQMRSRITYVGKEVDQATNTSMNPLNFPYEIFLHTNVNEKSLDTFLEKLKNFAQERIRADQAHETETKATTVLKAPGAKVFVANTATMQTATMQKGKCPVHPNSDHTALQCQFLKRMAKNLHPNTDAQGGTSSDRNMQGTARMERRASSSPYYKPRPPPADPRPQASASQKAKDPTGRYQGTNWDPRKWEANHATLGQEEKADGGVNLVQAMQAAISPRVHFDPTQLNAFAVIPVTSTDMSIDDGGSTMNIEPTNFIPPPELIDIIQKAEDFHDYLTQFTNNNHMPRDTMEAYLTKRRQLLDEINDDMASWNAQMELQPCSPNVQALTDLAIDFINTRNMKTPDQDPFHTSTEASSASSEDDVISTNSNAVRSPSPEWQQSPSGTSAEESQASYTSDSEDYEV